MKSFKCFMVELVLIVELVLSLALQQEFSI